MHLIFLTFWFDKGRLMYNRCFAEPPAHMDRERYTTVSDEVQMEHPSSRSFETDADQLVFRFRHTQ